MYWISAVLPYVEGLQTPEKDTELDEFPGSYKTRSKSKIKMLRLKVGGRVLTRLLKKLPGELHKVAILAAHHMTLHASWLGVAPTPLSRLDNSPKTPLKT
jgi:hypothetical protein